VKGDEEPEWRYFAGAACLLITDSLLIGIAPDGPWEDGSFSRGLIGLCGLCFGYVAWYRFTFKRQGLIPWTDLWEDPHRSARKEFLFSIIVLAIAWIAGNPLQANLPNPTGLVISLIGLLMLLQAVYVMLSIGPLKEE
jgi:hypothetical protein|tara:strand:+ start:703 stop:1116 length:414 start_codon:yes stop_codon:yes gene_type:complete